MIRQSANPASYKEIELTRGKIAIVDINDYDWLSQWNWTAYPHRNTWYAKRVEGKTPNHRSVLMHREILSVNGNLIIDHINGNGLDNRKENLRICSASQNSQNRKAQSNNTTGYKGVSWNKHKSKYEVYIQSNGIKKYLGSYLTAECAAKVYDENALILHGEFANLNFGDNK